jgi:hypothetical protein
MHRFNACLFSIAAVGISVAQTLPESASPNRVANSPQSILPQPPNSAIDSFGTVTFKATGNGSQNAIVGAVRQTGTGGSTFPTGITGYGSMESSGNQAFGVFGRCDLGIHLRSSFPGTCTNELNSFNFNGTPSTIFPPNLGFGTTQNNAISLQLVAYGDYDSSIALNIAGGGGAKQFYVGEYFNPQSSIYSSIFVDATSLYSPKYAAILKASSANTPLRLETVGKPVGTNAVAEYYDGTGVNQFTLDQAGDLSLGGVLSVKSIVGLAKPLSVSQGGTSSTSATEARSVLGAAQSGKNSDITSMTAINTISLTSGGSIKLAAVSVASLPTCNSELKDVVMAVTDAAAPAYNGPLTGGGTSSIPVFCNGVVWTAH